MFNRELKPKPKLKSKIHYKLSDICDALESVFYVMIPTSLVVGIVGAIVGLSVTAIYFISLRDKGLEEYMGSAEYQQAVVREISELELGKDMAENIETISSKGHARELFFATKENGEEQLKQMTKEENKWLIFSGALGGGIALSSLAFLGLMKGAEELSYRELGKANRLRREEEMEDK